MGQKDKISHFVTDYYKNRIHFNKMYSIPKWGCKRQTRVDMLVPTKKPVD